MGTSLSGLTPGATYSGLIKIGDNTALDGTLKTLSDGAGNDTVLALSNTSLQIGGSTGATWDNTNKRLGIGTATPGATLDVHSTGAIVAQFNKTVSGNSYIQQLTAGAAKWKHGFTTATGAFDIIDDVNSLTRLSVLNTGQLKLNAYTSTSAFTGTTAGFLAFDSSGNILSVTSPATSPAGTTGAVQFNNAGAFGADSTNFFWDDTNNRLGLGTATPDATLKAVGITNLSTNYTAKFESALGQGILSIANDGYTQIGDYTGNGYGSTLTFLRPAGGNRLTTFVQGNSNLVITNLIGNVTYQNTPITIVGQGSTSATTSLLVQNSAGSQGLKIADDLGFQIGSNAASGSGLGIRTDNGGGGISGGINTNFNNGATWIDDTNTRAIYIAYNGGVLFPNTTRYPITIGSSTKAVASAQLEMVSTTQGFLPPRMTTTQKNAIASPATGLQVFDSTMNAMCEYNGTAWRVLSAGAQSVAASTATTTVDMSAGNVQNITLTASTTLTLSSATVGTYIMKLIQGGSGSYTVTWPGTVIWSGGTAPTLTVTVGKVDIVTLVFDGTNFYGNYSLNY